MFKKYAAGLLILLFSFSILAGDKRKAAATAKAMPTQEIKPEDVPRISVDELILLQAKKAVFLIDVRVKDSYTEKILGAVQIPIDEIEARLKEIPRNKEIVTYCA